MGSRIIVAPKGILEASGPLSIQKASQSQQLNSTNSRSLDFLLLPHPRTSQPSLFLPYITPDIKDISSSNVEILEVQVVDPSAPRSWFMDNDTVLEDGRLLLFTPIDPAFLLLPILLAVNPEGNNSAFREADDIFNVAANNLSKEEPTSQSDPQSSSTLRQDIQDFGALPCTVAALSRLCETKDLGDQRIVYQFSISKTIQILQTKATRLSTPEIAARTLSISRSLAKDGLGPNENVDAKLREAGRTKLACDVLSQYLPPSIYSALLASYDFSSLNAYVRNIRTEDAPTEKPKQTKAKTATGSNGDGAGSKKRKAETQLTRGAQKLQKAVSAKNTKLTTFFKKKPEVEKPQTDS